MSKILRSAMALGAVFFAVGLTACGGVPDSAVLKVDGQTVSKEAFDNWMGIAASAAGQQGGSSVVPDPPGYEKCVAALKAAAPAPVKGQPKPTDKQFETQCKQQYTQLKDQVMTFLIRSQWLEAEAKKQGIELSDAAVKKELDKARKQAFPKPADYQKFLKDSGQTEADLLFRQRTQMLEQKVTEKVNKSAGSVTAADVTAYYAKNKDKQFTQPQTRDLRVVLTSSEKQAQEAKQALESGESWAKVAKRYSKDPTSKSSGGKLSGVQKGQGEKAFDDAVFKAPPNRLEGPVKTADGWYVFEVTKDTAAKTQPLTKDLEASIKQIVQSERQQAALTKFGKDYQERWRDKTECQKDFVVPDCSNSKKTSTEKAPPGAATESAPTTTQTTTGG